MHKNSSTKAVGIENSPAALVCLDCGCSNEIELMGCECKCHPRFDNSDLFKTDSVITIEYRKLLA